MPVRWWLWPGGGVSRAGRRGRWPRVGGWGLAAPATICGVGGVLWGCLSAQMGQDLILQPCTLTCVMGVSLGTGQAQVRG